MSYSIGEMSRMLDVTSYTLRYYEKEGIIPKIEKSDSGIRRYSEDDFGTLRFVTILKNTGMPLAKIKEYIISANENPEDRVFRRNILVEHRDRIIENIKNMNEVLEKITHKIEVYDRNINC